MQSFHTLREFIASPFILQNLRSQMHQEKLKPAHVLDPYIFVSPVVDTLIRRYECFSESKIVHVVC